MSCFNCIHNLVMKLFSIIYSPITRVHRQLVSIPRKRTACVAMEKEREGNKVPQRRRKRKHKPYPVGMVGSRK